MAEYTEQPYFQDKDMPEPEPLLVKSWEDFFPYTQKITQKKWNRDPTKQEMIDVFESLDEIDCENGTYWTSVECTIDVYFEDQK